MIVLALATLGAGLVLLPRRRPPLPAGVPRLRRGARRATDADQRGVLASRRAPPLAAAALAVACLLLLGPMRGAAAAAVVAPGAALALQALARRPPVPRIDRSLALLLDLWAAGLRAGRTVPDALVAAVPAARDVLVRQSLLRVAGLLRLGADPRQAWAPLASGPLGAGPLAAVAATALRTAESGARAAASFERLADEIRAECSAAATARAHRSGIVAMGPLGACFLPSFVCLGIAPVVVGIARSALTVLH